VNSATLGGFASPATRGRFSVNRAGLWDHLKTGVARPLRAAVSAAVNGQTCAHITGGKSLPKPDLIIDSNERGPLCDAVERKANKAGLAVVRQRLVVGDYLLGRSCVEAKSITDLFQSSHSGHLWRQLENMDANHERFFLLIHGGIDKYLAMAKNKNPRKRLTYSRIQSELTGTIARIMADFDCQVFYTANVSEASLFVVKLHDKLHKPASAHGARAIRRVSTNDVRKDVLLAMPGIGPDLADRLLDKCGSIEEMLHPASLKQVKGLGDKKRAMIIEVLSSEEEVRLQQTVRRGRT